MSYRLSVRPNAELQATEAYEWYEDKLAGLGGEFLLSLDACINAIERNPHLFQKRYKNIRMGMVERFPFGV
jgi:toxin ParE1/3/4